MADEFNDKRERESDIIDLKEWANKIEKAINEGPTVMFGNRSNDVINLAYHGLNTVTEYLRDNALAIQTNQE